MHRFDEHHPELNGFSDFFHKDILPLLAAQEGARRAALSKAKRYSALLLVAGALFPIISLYGISLYVLGKGDPVWFIKELISSERLTMLNLIMAFGAFYLVLAFGIHLIFSLSLKSVKGFTKDKIVAAICQYVGWTFAEKLDVEPDLTPWLAHGLLPKYDRALFEDRIFGAAHGADFDSCEAHLQKRERDSNGKQRWVTKFRGQIITLAFPRKFLGTTVVLRDAGIFNRKRKGEMKRVGLVDPVFEKIFEAYGTDQVEARYLLTPTFMQRLVDLEKSVGGSKARFGFIEGKLIIAIETKNRFEAGSMFKPLGTPERTQKILDEIGAVYDLIDGVMKPAERRV